MRMLMSRGLLLAGVVLLTTGFYATAQAVEPATPMRLALPTAESPLMPSGVKKSLQETTPVYKPPLKAPITPQVAPAGAVAAAKPAELTPDSVGRVIWTKGKFIALQSNNKQRELTKASIIFVGDTLITDDKTQAQIAFTDNSLMTFRPSTKFKVVEYKYAPEAKEKNKGSVGKYVMELVTGGFRTITGLIPKGNPDDYKVKTPVATIGVRGTDYAVYVGERAGKVELLIERLAGSPCVSAGAGSDQCFDQAQQFGKIYNGKIDRLKFKPKELEMDLKVIQVRVEPIKPNEAIKQFQKAVVTEPGSSGTTPASSGTAPASSGASTVDAPASVTTTTTTTGGTSSSVCFQ